MKEILKQAKGARAASLILANASAEQRNRFLSLLGKTLIDQQGKVIEANQKDLAQAKADGKNSAYLDRLGLSAAGSQRGNRNRLQHHGQLPAGLASLPDRLFLAA